MDIIESSLKNNNFKRHPWEIARFFFIHNLIMGNMNNDINQSSILDIGCGDHYIGKELKKLYPGIRYIGLDTAIDRNIQESDIMIINSWERLPKTRFDIILLLDVLEHVENDLSLLKKIHDELSKNSTLVVITVPIHQFLFDYHDIQFKHNKRYSMDVLHRLVNKSNFRVNKKGNFFFTLFIIKLFEKFVLTIFNRESNLFSDGVSQWNKNQLITKVAVNLLKLDSTFLRFLPGLSGYMLCTPK